MNHWTEWIIVNGFVCIEEPKVLILLFVVKFIDIRNITTVYRIPYGHRIILLHFFPHFIFRIWSSGRQKFIFSRIRFLSQNILMKITNFNWENYSLACNLENLPYFLYIFLGQVIFLLLFDYKMHQFESSNNRLINWLLFIHLA